MTTILFVCTANRYRSPLAAAIFQQELRLRRPGEHWTVVSAGTWADNGSPAAAGALVGGQSMGLNLGAHRSRSIDAELVRAADLILVMEQGQKEAIRSEFPESAGKMQLISEATTGVAYDVPDPVGPADGTNVAAELSEMIHAGFERICALVGK